MLDERVRSVTGISGVIIGALGPVIAVLYFMYSGPPPAWNVLTRCLLNLITCGLLIVFIAGFCHLIRQAGADSAWVASLAYGAGLIYTTVTLIAASLEAGVVFAHPDGTIDPTFEGPLAEGSILMHGSITRVLTIVFMLAAGHAVIRTKLLGVWAGRSAYVIALINLACVPSIYFGKDPSQFYSAVGWGNSALTASLILYWILAVSIALLKQIRTVPSQVLEKV